MTKALPWFMYQDPAIVCEQQEAWRNNQARRKQEPAMTINDLFSEAPVTKDESAQFEDILLIWYRISKADKENLGYSPISPGFEKCTSTDVYFDEQDAADAADEKINHYIAEQVDVCLSTLPAAQRIAVDVHARNKYVGNAVFRNPRVTPEEQHIAYQAAKATLLPMLRKRDLITATT